MSCFSFALVGFFIARFLNTQENREKSKRLTALQLSDAELKSAERAQRELYNMLTYDGSVQKSLE